MIAHHATPMKDPLYTAADFDRLRALVGSGRYRAGRAQPLETLREELDRGTVVPVDSMPDGVVTMHSRVRVRDLKTRDSQTYTLVYPDEADIYENRLSVLAPLGIALLGMRVGQAVAFDAPGGRRRLTIEKILYQPEANGDFHL